jgi:Mg2+ and Co2+ transporter CorA
MNITINIIELASELASERLHEDWEDSIKIYRDDTIDMLEYTDEAQDIFNDLYDKYYSIIENTKAD